MSRVLSRPPNNPYLLADTYDRFYYCEANQYYPWPEPGTGNFVHSNYAPNVSVMGYQNTDGPVNKPFHKIDSLKQPSRTCVLVDGKKDILWNDIFLNHLVELTPGDGSPIAPVHQARFNTLFIDGHCDSFSFKDLPDSFAYNPATGDLFIQ